MRASVARVPKISNRHPDERVGKNRHERRLISQIASTARALWPRKSASQLAAATGVEQRTAERWLAGTQELSSEAIGRLLRSEHGLDFLVSIMADARPRWWVQFRATSKVAAMRREHLRIKEALHDAEQLAATLARAETAMAVSDPDFHRDQIDALGAARGNLRGAMAR